MQLIDRTGHVYGRLRVISRAPDKRKGYTRWTCVCSCGNVTVVASDYLKTGGIVSCGCKRREDWAAGGGAKTHGMRKAPEYEVWAGMHQRCSNPNHKAFERYGARGITVCERWQEFANFYADMGPRPMGRYSVERINNDLGYSPDNCRWATDIEQAANRRKRGPNMPKNR